MRTCPILPIVLAGLLAGPIALAAPPGPAEAPRPESRRRPDLRHFSLEQLYHTRLTGGGAWSPDGKQVVFTSNATGRVNLWLVPQEGGWPTQLTVSDQRQADPVWSPDGRFIAYQSDHDGDEQWDMFLVSPESGEVTALTATPDVSEEEPAFSPDGKRLAYAVKPRASSVHEIYVMDLATRKAEALTSGTPREFGNHHPIWSRDGKRLAFTRVRADEKDSDVYVADVATKRAERVTPDHAGGERTFAAAAFSPDGRRLLVGGNAEGGYENVALLDIGTRALTWLTRDRAEISPGTISPDGRWLTYVKNDDGNFDVYLYDVARGRAEALPLPHGENDIPGDGAGFSADGTRLLYGHSGPDRPHDLWIHDLRRRIGRQVTRSLIAGVRSEDMVEPFLVHYPSFDGRRISAWLYLPYNLSRDGKSPGVVWVHGGPTSQSVNGFLRSIQYLVNNGYVVIAPNYRGSTGYGKEFMDANRMDMGGGDLKDVVAAAGVLRETGYVDGRRVALAGGSYGGFMTLIGLTKTPEVWAAGVALVPFVNWFTEVKNEDPQLQQYDLQTMGDPVKNRALWEDRSPIHFVDRVRAPLLILAGQNDPRCPRSESDQFVAAIKKRGGVVEYRAYENEGHGFSRIENQIDSFQRIVRFLDRSLKR